MGILLVEDNVSDATLLKEFLSEEKYVPEVYWVQDGQQALDFILQRGNYENAPLPDLIILDLALPRISGYEVLRLLKHQFSKHSTIPIIILTTSTNPADTKSCLHLGADAFFSKPMNLQGYDELIQTLTVFEFPRLMHKRQQATQKAPSQH